VQPEETIDGRANEAIIAAVGSRNPSRLGAALERIRA
jgi:hypothetical protein